MKTPMRITWSDTKNEKQRSTINDWTELEIFSLKSAVQCISRLRKKKLRKAIFKRAWAVMRAFCSLVKSNEYLSISVDFSVSKIISWSNLKSGWLPMIWMRVYFYQSTYFRWARYNWAQNISAFEIQWIDRRPFQLICY